MKNSIIRPLLMVVFVLFMVFLFQKDLEERKELEEQQTEIDPNSVIYSDIQLIEGAFPESDIKSESNNEENVRNKSKEALHLRKQEGEKEGEIREVE